MVEPWHLASTLVTPTTSHTARIGPPAITPVPSAAGCMNTFVAPTGDKVLASASTLEPEVRKDTKNGGNKAAAAVVGKRIAERAKAVGVETVAFDRSGYRYHGRVQALADAAREHGLKF